MSSELHLERSQGLRGDHDWKGIRLDAENWVVGKRISWCKNSGGRELVDPEIFRRQKE